MVSKHPPYWKPTFAQVGVRREKVVDLTIEGHSIEAIADALGVSASVVAADRGVMRHRLAGTQKRTWKSPRPETPPAPYNWLGDDEEEPDVTAYARTTPVRSVESLNRQLTGTNAMNRLAHNIDAAQASGDTRWLVRSARQIDQAMEYLAGMRELFEDDTARREAASALSSRDDLSSRSLDPSHTAQPLPVKNGGVLPSVTFAWIWRYWMAGIPLDDGIVHTISTKLHVSPARVERAAREFEARYQEQAKNATVARDPASST